MKTSIHLEQRPILDLCSNDIHLWITQAQYIHAKSLLNRYNYLLTEDEALKHKSYKFEIHRHTYLVTRAFIRDILSHYSDTPPRLWQFKAGAHGKPEVVNSQIPLQFNLSHTDDLIICAVTLNHAIGCDVENTRRTCEYLGIAEHFFARNEFEELLNKTGSEQRNRFFEYWTLKESYIKACGQGLSIPLEDFNFKIGSPKWKHFNDNIRLLFTHNRHDKAESWSSWLFSPNQEHKIAISIKSEYENQTRAYKFRFFDNIPLLKTTELPWPSIRV